MREPATSSPSVGRNIAADPTPSSPRCCCSGLAEELEKPVLLAGEVLVSEVGVQNDVLWRADLVVGRELRRRRADRVHQAGRHLDPRLDAVREVLHVDVTELRPRLLLALVPRVEAGEVVDELLVGVLREIHLPYPAV